MMQAYGGLGSKSKSWYGLAATNYEVLRLQALLSECRSEGAPSAVLAEIELQLTYARRLQENLLGGTAGAARGYTAVSAPPGALSVRQTELEAARDIAKFGKTDVYPGNRKTRRAIAARKRRGETFK